MSLWDEVKDFGSNVVDGFKDIGDAFTDFFDDPLGSLEDAFNGIFDIISLGTYSYVKDKVGEYIASLIPEQDFEDRKRTIRSDNQPRNILYGRNRVGGQIVYVEDDAKDNIVLWICYVLAGHRCEEVEAVYANGELVATSNGPGINGAMNRPANKFGDNILCWSVHGNTVQAFIPSMNVSSSDSSYSGTFSPPNWTTSHKLTYQTYVWVGLVFDKETFGDTGLPKFEFDVKGKDDIYDPRTGLFGYTDNHGLILLDILRWSEMFGEPNSAIDMGDFIDLANIADEQVPSGVGVTEKRYTVNGSFKMQTVPMDILSSIARAGAAYPYFDLASGKWKVTPGVFQNPVLSFDESDLVGGVSFQPGPPKNSRHNIAKGTFIDPNQNFESVGFTQLYFSDYVSEDLEELENIYKYPWTNSPTMARRLSKIDIERNRYGISCKVVLKFRAIRLSPGDRINLSIAEFGWSPKIFRVEEVEISLENGVAVSLREDASAIYDWVEGDALTLDNPPVLSIPDGLSISTPTNVAISESLVEQLNGSKQVALTLSWADQRSASAYDIQYKKSADSVWINAATYWQDTSVEIVGLTADSYDIRLRAISGVNTKSNWYTDSYTVTGFLSQSLLGIALQATVDKPKSPLASFSTIRATVTPPSDATYDHALVYYQLQGDSAWFLAGPTNISDYIDIVVNTDGSTYNVRAVSVSTSGTIDTTFVSSQITVLNSEDSADIPTIAPLSAVTNLGVNGTTSFNGQTADISWTDPNEESAFVRSFRVTIKDTSFNVMRTTVVTAPHFEYTFEMNAVDYDNFHLTPGTNRSFIVEVTVIGNLDSSTTTHESPTASVTLSNPAPGQPSSVAVVAGYQQAKINLRKPTDLDYIETRLYLSETSGFTADDSTYVASAYDGSVTIGGLQTNTTYYLRLRAYDPFGPGNLSAEISFTTAQLASGGPWAGITVADKTFIDQYMANNAIASTKIENLVAGKIATGYLAATTSIGVGDPASKPYTVTIGEKDYGVSGIALLSIERNSDNHKMLAFYESGTLDIGSNTRFNNNGDFIFGSIDKSGSYLEYDQSTGILRLKGSLTIVSATGYNNLTDKPTSLSNINSTEGTKLDGIEDNATNTTNTNQLTDGANLGGTADWSGVTGSGKPADNADVTNYADARVANAINSGSVTTIARPGGARYSGVGTQTGAIKITLPVSWTNTMMYFSVDVYNYVTDTSFTLQVGGYNHSSGWLNCSARLIGNVNSDNAVRFGHDGTKCCILIGETNSSWSYLKVTVRDFQAAHSSYAVGTWDDGWSIGLVTTMPSNIDATISDALLDARSIKGQGALATKDDVAYTEITGPKPPSNATYGADWAATLSNIPSRLTNTPTSGLNITATYLGYYDGTDWGSYIDNQGNVFLGDFAAGQYLDFNVATGVFQLGPNTSIGSNANKSYTVGSGGDFSSINAALESLSRTVPAYKAGGFTAEIVVLDGHDESEAIHIVGLDLGWITITKQTLSTAMTTTGVASNVYITASDGAVTPKFNLSIDASNLTTLILVENNSTAILGDPSFYNTSSTPGGRRTFTSNITPIRVESNSRLISVGNTIVASSSSTSTADNAIQVLDNSSLRFYKSVVNGGSPCLNIDGSTVDIGYSRFENSLNSSNHCIIAFNSTISGFNVEWNSHGINLSCCKASIDSNSTDGGLDQCYLTKTCSVDFTFASFVTGSTIDVSYGSIATVLFNKPDTTNIAYNTLTGSGIIFDG